MSTAAAEPLDAKRSVLGRAFKILECFAGGETEMSITALCAHTDLPPATVHRMLANLVEWGAIERAGRGQYRLGRRLWRLGNDVPSSRGLKDVARPCLVDLHNITREIAVLSSVDGHRMMVADVIAGRSALQHWTSPRHLPMAETGPGLVVLANLPMEEARTYLDRPRAVNADPTVSSDFELRQKFGEIRRTGIAVAEHEGMTWISAPVFDAAGNIRSTVSAVVPSQRCNAQAIGRVVSGAGRAISQGMRELGVAG